MNIKTIAEFVEDENTMNAVHEIGVDYAQGYVIAKPVPIEVGLFSDPVMIDLPDYGENAPIQLGAWSGNR